MKLPRIAAAIALMVALPATAAGPAFQTAAPIAYMIDLSSGAVLYSKDADRRVPPASMVKMMTSHVIFDMIDNGEVKLDQKFVVRPETWEKWHGPSAGSTMFLKSGEQVSVENLLNGVITLSGNDACVALAEGVAGTEQAFVGKMNVMADKLGMKNSHFGTSNGWPDKGVTYSTAQDLAILGVSTLRKHPALYKKFYGRKEFSWGTQVGGGVINQANRNPILGKIAGADGIKTGHTEEAGYGFTGSAEQNGRRLVMVVAGIESFNGRIAESIKFMDWGFKAWVAKPLAPKGKIMGSAPVQMGSVSSVALIAPAAVTVTLPVDAPKLQYALSTRYEGPIKAPIRKGQQIGELVVRVPGMAPQVTPLVAADSVGEAGFLRRAYLGALSLVGM
jgi:serine-type D-Ala-D-Ala carboxypeptidase (penicillin-binding protein 5/6)